MHRRVLVIIHNPIADRLTGRKLHQVLGWYDPDVLAAEYARDVQEASHGLLRYEIVERIEKDGLPAKVDGYCYDVDTYLRCWTTRSGFHKPDGVDYHAIIREFGVVDKVNSGHIDEVWLMGVPEAGYWESIMVGPGSIWCNSNPLHETADTRHCGRRFVIMGFNYEREVGCMLEDLGHRAESMMEHLHAGKAGDANLWQRFTRYDQTAPGHASCGNVHFAPNSVRDYDWGNTRPVSSDCDDWLHFPHLTGARRTVACRDWGNGDMRLHHLWWLQRLPHVSGQTDGISHNWWTYIGDPNTV